MFQLSGFYFRVLGLVGFVAIGFARGEGFRIRDFKP